MKTNENKQHVGCDIPRSHVRSHIRTYNSLSFYETQYKYITQESSYIFLNIANIVSNTTQKIKQPLCE